MRKSPNIEERAAKLLVNIVVMNVSVHTPTTPDRLLCLAPSPWIVVATPPLVALGFVVVCTPLTAASRPDHPR